MLQGHAPTAAEAVARYEAIAGRLPAAEFPATSEHRLHLDDLLDEFDVFVLDGFGVLNIGDAPVPGAVDRVRSLQASGKSVYVLTNGASFPSNRTCEKYRRWDMQFAQGQVVSSRDALARALSDQHALCWGFAALAASDLGTLVPNAVLLGDDPDAYDACDGFILLGTGDWSYQRHQLMLTSLKAKPRALLVGNPDLVAPHAAGLSREPGLFAHALADSHVAEPQFFGKPFDNAFAILRESLTGVSPKRIAMVGDTLHTDILGGAQAGWRTVLVTGHGLLKDQNVAEAISRSGITPDFIIPTT